MAEGLRAAREEAQSLSRIQAPSGGRSGAVPGVAPPGPGGVVLGPNGVPVSSPRTVTAPVVGSGGGSGDGRLGGGGGGGGGKSRTTIGINAPDPWVQNTAGTQALPLSWIESNCSLVAQPILNSLGAPTGQTRQVWDCGGLGTFVPPLDAPTRSGSSSGGGGGSRRSLEERFPPIGIYSPYGAGPLTVDPQTGRPVGEVIPQGGLSSAGPSSGSSSGPTSVSGNVSAPGVEAQQQETNRLLRRIADGGGHTGLRAEGLV